MASITASTRLNQRHLGMCKDCEQKWEIGIPGNENLVDCFHEHDGRTLVLIESMKEPKTYFVHLGFHAWDLSFEEFYCGDSLEEAQKIFKEEVTGRVPT